MLDCALGGGGYWFGGGGVETDVDVCAAPYCLVEYVCVSRVVDCSSGVRGGGVGGWRRVGSYFCCLVCGVKMLLSSGFSTWGILRRYSSGEGLVSPTKIR